MSTKLELRECFLANLINERKFSKVVELGVRGGRVFLHLLAACPETTVIGVDTWRYRPENVGLESLGKETYYELNMKQLENKVRTKSQQYGNRAIIHKLDTSDASTLYPNETLDLVFIDADHSTDGVITDIQNWFPKIKKSGIICGHDIDWPSVKTAVNSIFDSYDVGPDNLWIVTK